MAIKEIVKSFFAFLSDMNAKTQEEYQGYLDRYENCDVEQLKRYYDSATGVRKMALASLLREKNGGVE